MRARRTDANLTDLVNAFRKLGCSVHVTNRDWDLTIGYGGLTMLCEAKDGAKPPSARKLTKNEEKFHSTWTGGIRIIKDLEDVAETVKVLQGWRLAICNAL